MFKKEKVRASRESLTPKMAGPRKWTRTQLMVRTKCARCGQVGHCRGVRFAHPKRADFSLIFLFVFLFFGVEARSGLIIFWCLLISLPRGAMIRHRFFTFIQSLLYPCCSVRFSIRNLLPPTFHHPHLFTSKVPPPNKLRE